MDEEDWFKASAPQAMLDHMEGPPDRKLRLFACAACRRIWRFLADERARNAVETSERYADGLATDEELASASAAAWEAHLGVHDAALHGFLAACFSSDSSPGFAAREAADAVVAATVCDPVDPEEELEAQAALLRDVFGNPFRQVALDPTLLDWNDGAVAKIAQSIYDARRFADLPILADALEDAGCDDRQILDHCRSGGEHVRGCWVVDLLLGKK